MLVAPVVRALIARAIDEPTTTASELRTERFARRFAAAVVLVLFPWGMRPTPQPRFRAASTTASQE